MVNATKQASKHNTHIAVPLVWDLLRLISITACVPNMQMLLSSCMCTTNDLMHAHVCLTVLPLSPLLAHSPKYVQYSQPILVHKNVCPVLEYITAPGSIWCWCLRFCFLLGWKSSSSKSITCDNTAIVCQLLEILDPLPMFSWTCHKQWCGNRSGIVVRLFSP